MNIYMAIKDLLREHIACQGETNTHFEVISGGDYLVSRIQTILNNADDQIVNWNMDYEDSPDDMYRAVAVAWIEGDGTFYTIVFYILKNSNEDWDPAFDENIEWNPYEDLTYEFPSESTN